MKITEILKKKMSFSFEVFPPKLDKPLEPLLDILDKLYRFEPDFISCTYGAGGTNKGRSKEICASVHNSGHVIVSHLTCIGNTRADIKAIMGEYIAGGLENVLALRGDFQKGQTATAGDFEHADALIEFLKAEFPQVTLAAAGYPEKHILAASFESDIAHLRSKQDRGAEFIMLQLCHDYEAYERYAQSVRKAGIHIPLIVGIMPVLAKEPAMRATLSNGCSIPSRLAAIIGKYGDDPESFKKAGIDYTVEQMLHYMSSGVAGIHIYTMNKYEDVAKIITASGIRVQKGEQANG